MGFRTLTVEAAPSNFDACVGLFSGSEWAGRNAARTGTVVGRVPRPVTADWPPNLVLIGAAASNQTGQVLMNSVGGPGDHVGGIHHGAVNDDYKTGKFLITVPSVRMDEVGHTPVLRALLGAAVPRCVRSLTHSLMLCGRCWRSTKWTTFT
jgi:hypothetical protein